MRAGAPSRHLSCSVQVIFSGLGLSFLVSGPSFFGSSLPFASSLPLGSSLSLPGFFASSLSPSVALGIGLNLSSAFFSSAFLSSGFFSSALVGSSLPSPLGLGAGAVAGSSPLAGAPLPPGPLFSGGGSTTLV